MEGTHTITTNEIRLFLIRRYKSTKEEMKNMLEMPGIDGSNTIREVGPVLCHTLVEEGDRRNVRTSNTVAWFCG